MLNIALGQLRRRPGRAAALAATLIAATAGFLLLASAGRTTDVRVQGSVHSAFRPAYDILVRPQGSTTTLERDERLVRPNYLSGVFGGITLAQYRRIRADRERRLRADRRLDPGLHQRPGYERSSPALSVRHELGRPAWAFTLSGR